MANFVTKNYIPQIDYVSRDYTAILADLTAIAKQFNPTWQVTDPSDIGVALLETFAYLGDILSFYTDRMASEGFIGTASQRASVLQIASMFGYVPTPSSASVVSLTVTNNDVANPVTMPALTQVTASSVVNGQTANVIFETNSDLTLAAGATGYVNATQGSTVSLESLGTSTGAPSQVFKLSQTGVIIDSTGSNIQVFVGNVAYNYSSALVDNSPYDSVFTTQMDSDGYTYIIFGDGVGGKIPPVTYSINATYRVGVGSQGNIPAGSINPSPSGNINVTISQPSAASGGADDESTDSIRYNVPRALRTLRRAVSLKDYAYLALQVSGVSKANADSGVWSSVNLYIAPFGSSALNTYGPFVGSSSSIISSITQTGSNGAAGSGYLTYTGAAGTFSSLTANSTYVTVSNAAPVSYNIYAGTNGNPGSLVTNVASDGSSFTVQTNLTTFPTYSASLSTQLTVNATGTTTAAFNTLKSSVLNYFTDKVAPNVSLTILPPTYVPINTNLTLHVLPQYSQSTVISQVQSVLSSFVSYSNAFFADIITPASLINAVSVVDGVNYISVEHLRRNSNEQIFYTSYWTRGVSSATVTAIGHNFSNGQNVFLYNTNGIDGTYAVTATSTNTFTITLPTGTASSTGTTGTISTGSTTMTAVASITGITVGMYVFGAYISSGTTVTAVGATTLTLSQAAAGNGTGASFSFAYPTADATSYAQVITVESTTTGGIINSGITCDADEIPTKGTFNITATGGL